MKVHRVAALLVLCLIPVAPKVFAQQSLPPEIVHYPDIVVYNGKVLTADDKFTIAEAVAIRDGKFLAVGQTQKILAMAGPRTQKFDLAGRSALPGLIDTHLHQTWVVEVPGTERRPRYDTLESCLADLKAIVAKAAPGEFIALDGPSNNVVAVELNAALLDQVAPNNPLYIEAANDQVVGNSLVVKQMLALHPDAPGIMKDKDGKPTGQFRGAAAGDIIYVLKPWPPLDKLVEPQKAALRRMNQVGLTTVIGRATPMTTTLLADMWRTGQLTTRVRIFHEFVRQNHEPEPYIKRVGNLTGFGDNLFKIAGATTQVVDGGGAASAATAKPKMATNPNAPYGPRGQNKWEETGDMARSDRRNIIILNRYGWTIGAMHSSGDESNTLILDAYEEANKERPLAGRHFGIDHGELWKPQHLPQLKALGVVPSVYSKAMYNNGEHIKLFGKDDVFKMQPVKSLFDAGIRPAAEADAWGAPANPFFNMKNWITRIDDKGWQLDPTEKITREQALYMYTRNSAAYVGDENLIGSIEPGKLADVIVTAGDYMTFPENDLDHLRVLLTIVDGKVVFQAPGAF